jgi:hypothetical protein
MEHRTMLSCGICRRQGRGPFRVPHDDDGMVQIDRHLAEQHAETEADLALFRHREMGRM